MGLLEDILKALERWPRWKRISDAPDRIDAIERRMDELDKRFERAPGEACPSCGAFDYRLAESEPWRRGPDSLFRRHTWRCEKCGFSDAKIVRD